MIVFGDTNLDHLKLEQPEPHLVSMVDMVKDQLETLGFAQIVTGITWCQKGQSSLLDQCWTNCGTRISSCRNLVCGASDHNLTEITIRIKGINKSPKETIKIQRNNFDVEHFKTRASEFDWMDVLDSEDVDVSYDLFETKIRKLLDEISPMKKVQISSKHKSWLAHEKGKRPGIVDLILVGWSTDNYATNVPEW